MTATATPVPATKVDLGLYPDIQRFGAADVSACFSCGTCTAVCPLSETDSAFPRRVIRFAQLGMKDALLSSKELWTCYACGECSESCPMSAEPSEFMAAARRYAIASYDHTGLARTMYTMPVIGTGIALILAAFFAAFMYASHGPQDAATLALFGFIPNELIHTMGLIVMAVVFLAGLAGIVTMARRLATVEGVSLRSTLGSRAALARSARALWSAIGMESLGQVRYRSDCDAEAEAAVPWYRRRWFIHAMTIWGFLGLLGATIADYGLEIIGWKATGTPVPIWYPVRLLGTAAGIALIYGTTMLIMDRVRKSHRSVRTSAPADWTLLVLLWITGVTGFGIELALYLPDAPAWGYWVFLFHVAIAMELVLLAPFMKLAHAVYRPVALFFFALRRERAESPAH
jgi:quinone-modifying oxidoreductase, subunit QmoC